MFDLYKEGSFFILDYKLEFTVLNIIGVDYKFYFNCLEMWESYGNLSDSSEIMMWMISGVRKFK